MSKSYPSQILITGGHEIGGVASFADALRNGFIRLGIPTKVIPPSHIWRYWRQLRDPRVLKILSTTAIYAAPFARRAIYMAHGVARSDYQGGWRTFLIYASYKLANLCRGVQLVAVSHFSATVLDAIFGIHADAVIYNAVKPIYLEPFTPEASGRHYITYIGRLIEAKNLHRILPAARRLMDENPGLHMCILGEGPARAQLEALAGGDERVEFKGAPDDLTVREWLRRTRIFVSGNELEGFGLTYVEALAQGCVVAMPALGGGLELAPESVGDGVQLFPLSWEFDDVLAVLRRALHAHWRPIPVDRYAMQTAVAAYLRVDSGFSPRGQNRRRARSGYNVALNHPATAGDAD